jgi:hypothetical protein
MFAACPPDPQPIQTFFNTPIPEHSLYMRHLLSLFLFSTAAVIAADAPKLAEIPAKAIGETRELLFSDDFQRAELGEKWGPVVPTFTLEKGALKGTQTRFDTPAVDGKPAVKGHNAVIGTDVPTKDSIIEVKIKFEGATSLSVEFDDRNFTGSHYGHICLVQVKPNAVILVDQRDGGMNQEIREMANDPAKKAERAARLAGRSLTYPLSPELEQGKWYTLVLETVGDAMRASIDGKAVGYLKSSGIAHPTKSKIELNCGSKDGYFDDIKVWNAVSK